MATTRFPGQRPCVCVPPPPLSGLRNCYCRQCTISSHDIGKMQRLLYGIPYRFWLTKRISWDQYEELPDEMVDIVWRVFRSKCNNAIVGGGKSLLQIVQEMILTEVRTLFRKRFKLELTQQDEAIFEGFNDDAEDTLNNDNMDVDDVSVAVATGNGDGIVSEEMPLQE